jgi:PAS domain S-box-containing protein
MPIPHVVSIRAHVLPLPDTGVGIPLPELTLAGLEGPGPDAGRSAAPAGVVVVDRHERIRHAEGEAFPRHAMTTDGWAGRQLAELLSPDAAVILLPRYRAALAGTPQSFDYGTQDATRTYRVQMVPVRDGADAVTEVVAVMQDITQTLRVTAKLARSEARLREAERMVGVGSWEFILGSGEFTFSPGFARLLGLDDVDRLTVEDYLVCVHPEDRESAREAGLECIRAGAITSEYRVIWPDGAIHLLSARAELIPAADGGPATLRGAVLDVTEQRAAERERLAAEHLFREGFDVAPIGMALSDPATGVCVRLNDALCELLQRQREDLIGQSMAAFTHPDDKAAVWTARERMRTGEVSEFRSEHRLLRPDGSILWGLLHLAPIRRADGSIQAFHTQLVDITERKEREQQLEHHVGDAVWLARIRAALDEDRLLLYAQPIVDLTTGATVQHELLLRMRTEDGSIIRPGEFLPVAERYGLISEIDRWVVREAVRIASGGTPTEFNLSARSVGDPLIIHELSTAISETGVDPSLLVVEVTETALLGRTGIGREFARRVRDLGCHLALDDFGTGFSSLSYLKHLPADYLKVDIEFVRELTTNEDDARVVRGIVGLAREFNQITIAEGVEDEATLLMLKELGVDQAQGYLFARPGPLPEAGDDVETDRIAPPSAGPDPVAIVREAFAAFANRDVTGILSCCRSDVVLRTFATSRLVERTEPYRGHEGVHAYLDDVARVWDQLTFTPMELRRTPESVIGFGRTEARRGTETVIANVLWVVRVQEGEIASIEVFQAVQRTQADAA